MHSIASDPLLRFISMNLSVSRQRTESCNTGSGSLGQGSIDRACSGSTCLSAEVQRWALQWEEIQIEKLVGRGSYGWVSHYLHHQHRHVSTSLKAEGLTRWCSCFLGIVYVSPSIDLSGSAFKHAQVAPTRSPNSLAGLPCRVATQVYQGRWRSTPVAVKVFLSRGK